MTFLELVTQQYPKQFIRENQFMLLLEAWNAAQAAERERIKQIVRDVTEGRSNCNLLLERIDR